MSLAEPNDPLPHEDPPAVFSDGGGHDEIEHPDERWLVSYADMMTLLFGLFVMLYSMANKFDQVQKSAAKEFSKPTEVKVEITQKELDQLKNDLSDSRTSIEALKVKAASLEDQRIQDKAQLNTANLKITELTIAATKQNPKIELARDLQLQVQDLKKAKTELDQKLTEAHEKNERMLRQIKELKTATAAPIEHNEQDLANLQSELTTTQEQKQELEKTIAKQKEMISALEQKANIAAAATASAAGSFAAVVITWSTQNHDIDLIVTDPEGKVFNYKHRDFAGHPGKFVLDTRRGPGAEMWQTDHLLPGVYQIKYLFYNTYGNNSPVSVSGSVYSQGGIFELPSVNLNFTSKREQLFKITISDKGIVQLVQ